MDAGTMNSFLESGRWGVWRVRFQVARQRTRAELVSGANNSPVWLEPEVVNILGEQDGLAVAERLRVHYLALELEDDTADPRDDGSFPTIGFTEFRLLGIRPVAVVNLK